MKSLFAKDINQAAFIAYEKFEMLKRPANMIIVDFRNEFERLYNNVEKYGMEFSTTVLTYILLKSVDISEDKQQLARATMSSLMYDDMKNPLKAIYDNFSTNEIKGSITEIKEPTYEVKRYEKSDRLGGFY